jgi:hypothetical protein
MLFGEVGPVKVITTQNRGMTADEWVELALDHIISVSDSAPMPIREQARAFKEQLSYILGYYFKKVAKSERTTIAAKLRQEGFPHIADKIEDIR